MQRVHYHPSRNQCANGTSSLLPGPTVTEEHVPSYRWHCGTHRDLGIWVNISAAVFVACVHQDRSPEAIRAVLCAHTALAQ
eukprot:1838848-Amphidinium_carterae.2